MEGLENLPVAGKLGLVLLFAFAVLWGANKLLVTILSNYEKLVDAQVRLNDSVSQLVVPELQKIGAHLHLLATEENASANKKELKVQMDMLSQQLAKVTSILESRGSYNNNSNSKTQDEKPN